MDDNINDSQDFECGCFNPVGCYILNKPRKKKPNKHRYRKIKYCCGSYIGETKDVFYATLRHGQGKMTFLNGDWREGLFEDGNFTGNGKMKKTYTNGTTYIGDVKNYQPDGQGKMTFSNEDCYEGGWKEGKMHGKGKFVWKDGDYYEGDWEKDKMHGKGKFVYENGDCYEGGWEKDKTHGQGKMTFSNGDCYEGDWEKDRIKQTRKIKKIPLNNTDNIFLQNIDDRDEADKEYFTQQQTKQNKMYVETKDDKLPQEDLNKKDHLKIMYSDHGNEYRFLDLPICNLPDADGRKSYYISDVACFGAFVDPDRNNLIDKIKEKIKGKNAVGFFSNVDNRYTIVYKSSIDANGKYGSRRLPAGKDGVNVNDEKFNNNKDKYFHYYCIVNEDGKQNIYKIPHQLCYWREALIDDTETSNKSKYPNKFMEALDTLKQGKPFAFKIKALVKVGDQLVASDDTEITISGKAEKAEVVIENGKIPEIKAIHNNENNNIINNNEEMDDEIDDDVLDENINERHKIDEYKIPEIKVMQNEKQSINNNDSIQSESQSINNNISTIHNNENNNNIIHNNEESNEINDDVDDEMDEENSAQQQIDEYKFIMSHKNIKTENAENNIITNRNGGNNLSNH